MKLSILALTAALSATAVSAPSGKLEKRRIDKIRGVSSPIYHLYLQADKNGNPAVGPEATAATFDISNTIKDTATGKYLNVLDSPNSYKPLNFSTTATTTGWGLEGDTIITTNGSPWGRQLNFMACTTSDRNYYKLYLQTGGTMPSGESCTWQTLHLPCLC